MNGFKAIGLLCFPPPQGLSRQTQLECRSIPASTCIDASYVPPAEPPITKLPGELLDRIFQERIDDDIRSFREPLARRKLGAYSFFALRQVCSYWRSIIDDNPFFWTRLSTVTLSRKPYTRMGPNVLQEFLDRSRSLPLVLYLEDPWTMGEWKRLRYRADAFTCFLLHLQRCGHLELRLDREVFNWFLALDLSVVPDNILSSVAIRGKSYVATDVLMKLFDFANIRRLEIDLEGTIVTEGIPWSNLTHLTIDNRTVSYEAGIELLLRCHNAESIALRISRCPHRRLGRSHRTPVITFPNLLNLKLSIDKTIAYVVQMIVAPKLRTVHLKLLSVSVEYTWWDASLLTQFLEHAHSLVDVEIIDLHPSLDYSNMKTFMGPLELCFNRHVRAFGLVVFGYPFHWLPSLATALRRLKNIDSQRYRQVLFDYRTTHKGALFLEPMTIRWEKALDFAECRRYLAYDTRLHLLEPGAGWWKAGGGVTGWSSREERDIFRR